MNEAGKIIDFNPAAEKTFGWRQEEIAGKTVGETIVPPELRKAHAQGLATFLATGEGPILGKRVEMTALHANGTKFPVELAISVTRLEGKLPFFTAYLRDLSERKKGEAALAQAQSDLKRYAEGLEQTVADRTEKLSRTVGELEAFSYSLSHDLRAPLRAIQGFSHMFLEDHKDKLAPRAADMLGKVIASANRMDRLILAVLAFTQVSQQEIKVERVDVEKLIRELIHERPELQAAEIRISSPLLAVLGDEASLTQCITNLLGNAVKFVAQGVRPEVEISTEAKGERVRVWFVDNGIGIEEGGQQRLFGLFQRQHASEEYEGTGMGLAIVRKAAQRMHGEVGVESEAGKGSRFWIELPKAD
jgi:PAS domain S-box-containing protein